MSTDGVERRRSRLERLLPYYLDGTLSEDERAEVEVWLVSDPAAAIALQEAEAGLASTRLNEAARPPAGALARLSAARERGAAARASWPRRTGRWLGALPSGVAWATAALAVGILAVQTFWDAPSQQYTSSVTGTTAKEDSAPFVLVNFVEDATILEISEIMQELGLQIAAGPMSGGLYRVSVPALTGAEYDEISARLRAAPVVVWLVAGSRPPDR